MIKVGIFSFEGRTPQIAEGSFVFETATVVGDVTLGKDVYVGPGAVVRGDYGKVVIGDRTSVEENVVIHARPGDVTTIGKDVTLGHSCVVHNCTVDDFAVIGMGAVVSDFSHVGRWVFVAEGSVVKTRSEIEDEMIVAGIPATPKKKISEELRKTWIGFKAIYPDLARRYPKGLKRLD